MFDALTELECAIDKVAAEVGDLDVARVCALADRVEFLRMRAIGAFDRSLAWETDVFLSSASATPPTTHNHPPLPQHRALPPNPEPLTPTA